MSRSIRTSLTALTALTALTSASVLAEGNAKGVVTASFAPGETYSAPETFAPATTSRYFVRTVTPLAGKAVVEIPAQGGKGLLVWAMPASVAVRQYARQGDSVPSGIATSLKSPSGKVLGASQEEAGDARRFAVAASEMGLELPEKQDVIHVDGAEPGLYTLEIAAPADTAITVAVAEPDSAFTLESWAGPLSRKSGEPVQLFAQLADGGSKIAGARVSARLASPAGNATDSIDLFDDGRHGDGAAGDGLYAASLADLPSAAAGFWTVKYEAEGKDGEGLAFLRSGSSSFMNERPLADLPKGSIRARIVNDSLRVEARANVLEAGDYRFDVIVAGGKSASGTRAALGYAESTLSLAKGAQKLSVDIPLADLGLAKGDAALVDVRLLGLTNIGVAGQHAIELNLR